MADSPSRGGVTGQYLTTSYSFGPAIFGATQGQGSGWFGPSAPMAPSAPPDVAGRQYDYPAGFNLSTRPRAYEAITFQTLRDLADGYDLLRTVIETRKDQLARMSWSIKNRDTGASDENDQRVKDLTTFFRRPDGDHGWPDWLRMVLEDLFVIDAPSLYMRRDRGGRLIELIPLDGSTIRPVIDNWGRTPRPYTDGATIVTPPAYQQVLKGLPAVDYSTRDLFYRPRNRRVQTPYGMSPVEQIVTTVNIALRRQLSTLTYFTEGNIPDMIVQVPKEWTPDQVSAFQKHWDSYFSGDIGRRRRAKFTPGVGQGGIHETRQIDLKGEFDEWLAKLVCFAFSISPQALTRQMNRASADTQKEMAEEEGLEPILLWVKAWIDDILAFEFEADDLEFAWGDDDEVDEAQKLNVLTGYVTKGGMTINEMRQEIGRDPFPDPLADQPMVLVGTGYVPLGAWQQQQDAAAAQAKLMADAAAQRPQVAQDGEVPPRSAAEAQGEARQQARDAASVEKYAPDQVRDERGRFAVGGGASAHEDNARTLSTRTKVALGIVGAGIASLALGAVTHRAKPYRSYSQAFLSPEKRAIHELHDASVHTPIAEHEREAVARYTGTAYAAINKKLRLGHKPTDDVTNIDAALNKSSLAQDTVVYRGLNLDRSNRILKSTQPGAIFVDRGYPSTTLSEDVGRSFAALRAGPGTGAAAAGREGYVLSINVDKGANALPLKEGFTGSTHLHEVLLPRNSAFKVLSVDHDAKTIYAQHLGVAMGKAFAPIDLVKSDEEEDRFLWSDGDLEFHPPHDDDTTAEDYDGYAPPQLGKAFDPSQPRDDDGKWTGDGASAKSWKAAEHEAMLIVKGTAIVAGAALAVFFAPEIAAAAGAVTGSEAVAGTAAAAVPWITKQAEGIANGFFGSAAYQAGLSMAKANGYDTSKVEDALRPFLEAYGIHSKAAKAEGKAPDAAFRKALERVVDQASDAILAAADSKAPEKVEEAHVEAVTKAVESARDAFKADAIASLGKRFDKAWGGYRRPDPVPFDRPATRRAEKGITERLSKAFAGLAEVAATALKQRLDKIAKAEPEDPEDRARSVADDVASEFDMSLLQDAAAPIADDLEDVASDSASRAIAQIGPDNAGDLVDRVNQRAVAAARARAAELVGMRWDADGQLVPFRNPDMAITDTTREELRQTIADGLANGLTTDEIAGEIAESYTFSPERAGLIAATEVSRSNSEAALASYQAAVDVGIPVRKEWLAEADCCDVCSGNQAAGPIDLDAEFPSGDDTPPGHPNCRCSLSPVVGDDPAEKAYDPNQLRDEQGRWAGGLDTAIQAARDRHPGVVRASFGPVRRAARLSAIVGRDVRGFRYSITNHGIAHAARRHGLKKEDFEALHEVMAAPESVTLGHPSLANAQPRLCFRAKVGNRNYTVIGEVQTGKRRIEMVSMW